MDEILKYIVIAAGLFMGFVLGRKKFGKNTAEKKRKEIRKKEEVVEKETIDVVNEADKVEKEEIAAADERKWKTLEEVEKDKADLQAKIEKDKQTGTAETINEWNEILDDSDS